MKKLNVGDYALVLLILVPLSIIFTGFTHAHVGFFVTSSYGYYLYITNAIKNRNWRWYADYD